MHAAVLRSPVTGLPDRDLCGAESLHGYNENEVNDPHYTGFWDSVQVLLHDPILGSHHPNLTETLHHAILTQRFYRELPKW